MRVAKNLTNELPIVHLSNLVAGLTSATHYESCWSPSAVSLATPRHPTRPNVANCCFRWGCLNSAGVNGGVNTFPLHMHAGAEVGRAALATVQGDIKDGHPARKEDPTLYIV